MKQTPQTTSASDANIAACIQNLGSWRAAKRDAAERELRRMGAMALEPLLALMRREDRRLAKCHRIGRGIERSSKMVMFSAVPVYLLSRLLHVPCPILITNLYYGSILISWTYTFFGEFWLVWGSRKYRQAIAVITESENLRVVGPLCACLAHHFLLVERPLIKLLPSLQTSDAHLLNAHERTCLHKRLRTNTRGWFQEGAVEELTLAILKALEQIGDGQAMPYVQQAAQTAKSPKVREAAMNCLPYLTQRAEQERATNSLLRPSDVANIPDTTLLRAAQCASEVEPQQLLRTGIAENYAQTPSPELP